MRGNQSLRKLYLIFSQTHNFYLPSSLSGLQKALTQCHIQASIQGRVYSRKGRGVYTIEPPNSALASSGVGDLDHLASVSLEGWVRWRLELSRDGKNRTSSQVQLLCFAAWICPLYPPLPRPHSGQKAPIGQQLLERQDFPFSLNPRLLNLVRNKIPPPLQMNKYFGVCVLQNFVLNCSSSLHAQDPGLDPQHCKKKKTKTQDKPPMVSILTYSSHFWKYFLWWIGWLRGWWYFHLYCQITLYYITNRSSFQGV